ncbi:hypothetical protein LTR67_009663 [Exophiala xenobiotica]
MESSTEYHVLFHPNGREAVTINLPRTVRDTVLGRSLISTRNLEAHSHLITPLTTHETVTDQTGRNYILTGTVLGRWSVRGEMKSYLETFYVTGGLRGGLDALLRTNVAYPQQSSSASDGYVLEHDPQDQDQDQGSKHKQEAKDKERQKSKDKESQKNTDNIRQFKKGGGSGGGTGGSTSTRVVSK